MKMALVCAASLAAALGTCASASATIVDATFTGTLGADSLDNVGIFGPAGNDLAGDTYVLTYEYDTSLGHYLVNNPNEINLVGGGTDGAAFMIFASVTVNGRTGPLYHGDEVSLISTGGNTVKMRALDLNVELDLSLGPQMEVDGESSTGVIPVSIDTPQTITFDSTYQPEGFVTWGNVRDPASLTSLQFGSGTVSTLVYSIPGGSAVPETSTWAMMVLGFAGLGAAGVWRRSARSVPV